VARGRRKSGSFRRRGPKADWVYRPPVYSYDAEGVPTPEDGLGTYQSTIIAHAVGTANAQGHILYDSRNFMTHWAAAGTPNSAALAPQFIASTARADSSRRATMLAVQGVVFISGSDWALGSELSIGMRIGVFEQAPENGLLSIDPAYSMWNTPLGVAVGPWTWANGARGNAWERRPFLRYVPGQERNYIVMPVFWRGRRVLQENECFALYTELETSSNSASAQYWLRTLVVDSD